MSDTLLHTLQRHFESLYSLDPAPNITEFLIMTQGSTSEQVLILEEDDLYLAVVLDSAVMPKLAVSVLGPHNLHEFCLAVEGVSHFLFLIYCSRQQRSVTALEMELQGEVDKYIASIILANRTPRFDTAQVRRLLYDTFQLREGLDASEQGRYLQANFLARRYVGILERQFIRQHRIAPLLLELRQFYRRAYVGKLSFIYDRAA